jgi:hypothetical protein
MPLHATTRRNRLRIFAALLLLAGAGEFLVRGPIRFVRSAMVWNDFLSPYIQASAWAHGKDPYSAASIVLLWPSGNPQPDFIAREAANGTLPARRGIPSLYPVTSLVLLGPFVSLKWSTAETLWIALNTTALLVSLLALVAISGASWQSLRVQFFIAAALSLHRAGHYLRNPAGFGHLSQTHYCFRPFVLLCAAPPLENRGCSRDIDGADYRGCGKLADA